MAQRSFVRTLHWLQGGILDGANLPTADTLLAGDLPDTAVTPGSYTYAAITVDQQGRITACSDGTAPTTYTDENTQDAVGAMVSSSARVTLTYTDATPSLTADLVADSITAGYLHAATGSVLFGRYSAASGAGQEITLGSGLSLDASTGVLTGAGGTVTSVALTVPSILSVSGSPVTTSGTLAVTLATQSANRVFAGPTTGSAAAPTFRALVAADIPDLSATYVTGAVGNSAYQAKDVKLVAIAGTGTAAADTIPYYTSSTTASLTSLTAFGRSLIDDADAAAARTTLGLVIGTDVQAYDGTLAALAALTIAANSLTIGTGADAFSQLTIVAGTFPARASTGNLTAYTISDTGLSLVACTDYAAMRTALSLVPGTHVQAYDGTLAALAALTIAANSLTIGTGADAFAQTTFAANTFPARSSTGNLVAKTITDFALMVLDDADAATVRATLGVPGGSGTSTGTNTGDQTITLTGDVTGSGTSSVTATVVSASTSTAGKVQLADATAMEAASSTTVAVTPGVQHRHPSSAKAWVVFTVSGGVVTIVASYNVASITRNAAGDFTINFTTAFSTANYSAEAVGGFDGANYVSPHYHGGTAPTAPACRLQWVRTGTATPSDPARASAAFFGDQ